MTESEWWLYGFVAKKEGRALAKTKTTSQPTESEYFSLIRVNIYFFGPKGLLLL